MAHQKCYPTCSAVNDVLMLWRAILLTATTFDIVGSIQEISLLAPYLLVIGPPICKGLLDAIVTRWE